jgi:hypothetical protein
MSKRVKDVVQRGVQVVYIVGNDVRQAPIFRLVPNMLDRIEVRSVCRKPFQLKPRVGTGQKLSRSGTMRRQAIPHQDDGATQVGVKLLHELNEIRRSRVVIQQLVVQSQSQCPRRTSDGYDGRDSIASIRRALQGGTPLRRPDSSSQRLQQEAAFVDENQASLAFEALFLVAAMIRDASGQSPPRFVRALGAPAFAGSSPTDAAAVAHTPDETRRRTIVGSSLAPTGPSSHPARSRNCACRASMPRPILVLGWRKASTLGPDAASIGACCRVSMPSSSDAPMKCSNPRPQPLPSTTRPSRRAWLRFYDGLRASRGFQRVSCPNYTKAKSVSIN